MSSLPLFSTAVSLLRWQTAQAVELIADELAVEEPLEIRVNGRSVAVTMRTPGHDRELATGFLFSEGVIRGPDDLLDILVCRTLPDGQQGNIVDVQVRPELAVDFDRLTRHVFSASSCGLCGKATLDSVFQTILPVSSDMTFDPALVATLPSRIQAAQPGFDSTGGVHASAIFSRHGQLRVIREDIGRHNALDKILGHALLHEGAADSSLRDAMLLVSGRVSFELVQKALVAGIPLIAGIGAPSSLAVECAQRGGQTLVGFLRADRMNVYAGAERLGLAATPLGLEVAP